MTGIIYKITSPSGKVYIGQTINLKTRVTLYNITYESITQAAKVLNLSRTGVRYKIKYWNGTNK